MSFARSAGVFPPLSGAVGCVMCAYAICAAFAFCPDVVFVNASHAESAFPPSATTASIFWARISLRHYFITELVRRGVGLEPIRTLAAHSKLDMTQRYAHATAADLRAAIDKLAK